MTPADTPRSHDVLRGQLEQRRAALAVAEDLAREVADPIALVVVAAARLQMHADEKACGLAETPGGDDTLMSNRDAWGALTLWRGEINAARAALAREAIALPSDALHVVDIGVAAARRQLLRRADRLRRAEDEWSLAAQEMWHQRIVGELLSPERARLHAKLTAETPLEETNANVLQLRLQLLDAHAAFSMLLRHLEATHGA